jgi:hypothetical protein
VERAKQAGVALEEGVVKSKAEGLAYALRNASDYYQARDVRNVSQRVVNLYYGSMSFAFAEMLASPRGPATLTEIEDSTRQGHGLYTIDGPGDGLDWRRTNRASTIVANGNCRTNGRPSSGCD